MDWVQWNLVEEHEERFLEHSTPDGSILSIHCYEYPSFYEYTWEIDIFDDATGYFRDITSANMDLCYNDVLDAYDGLHEHIELNFINLFAEDPIVKDFVEAREEFSRIAGEAGFTESKADVQVKAVIYAWEYGESHVHGEVLGHRKINGDIEWDDPSFNPDDYDDEYYSVEVFDI